MSLNVTWAIPQSDMNITQYQVHHVHRTSKLTSWSSGPLLSVSPPATSTVVNGMDSGSECKVKVRAMSVVGAGKWSEEQKKRFGSESVHCSLSVSLQY